MTQEQKDKLLKYLCMALPYGVKVHYATSPVNHCDFILKKLSVETKYDEKNDLHYYPRLNGVYPYFDCQPYLRPMSSMTEEEKDKFIKNSLGYTAKIGGGITDEKLYFNPKIETLEFLLEYHFDFMGLIPMGVAIKITNNNDPYKN